MVETRYVEIPPPAGPLDLSRPHFVGICGAGMSALAHLLAGRGAQVSGSDLRMGESATALEEAGCRVRAGHDAANTVGASVVVWSSVIDAANPEIIAARAAGVPVAHRSHVLTQLVAEADRSVVVAGTHGKSTATMLLAAAVGHLHPSWVAGAAPAGSVNGRTGSGLLIAEGDESDRSVALYRPDVAVVLNADDDHPETFAGTGDVVATLTDFAAGARALVVCADDAGAREVANRVRGHGDVQVVTFGASARRRRAAAVGGAGAGRQQGDRARRRRRAGVVDGAYARSSGGARVARRVRGGPGPGRAARGAGGGTVRFAGVRRRMEMVGERRGVRVVDSSPTTPPRSPRTSPPRASWPSGG
ncbi:Mur ligase domain-containing protein [Streptomyces diastatochromogenes]|nr:Mur ligase domain-containing protein [Streptomyces diastatochromogenes]